MAGIEAQDQTGGRDLGEWNNVSRDTAISGNDFLRSCTLSKIASRSNSRRVSRRIGGTRGGENDESRAVGDVCV